MRFTWVLLCLVCLAVTLTCAKGPLVQADRMQVGYGAPVFTLSDVFGTGETNAGKVFFNNNATVVVLWSMACPSCRDALVEIDKVAEAYESKAIVFLGVNFDEENIQGVRSFLKAEGIRFTTLWDRGQRVTRSYKALDYTFSVFIVDREGKVAMVQYDHPPDLAGRLAAGLDSLIEKIYE